MRGHSSGERSGWSQYQHMNASLTLKFAHSARRYRQCVR
jgi:hypothetical protein